MLEYAKKRFWRIFPQLWAVRIISVIVILFTYKELTSYINLEYNIKHRKNKENPTYCAKYWKEGNKCQKLKLIMEI